MGATSRGGVGGGWKFFWELNFLCFTAYPNLEQFWEVDPQKLYKSKNIAHIYIYTSGYGPASPACILRSLRPEIFGKNKKLTTNSRQNKNTTKHCKFYKRHTFPNWKIIEQRVHINYLRKRMKKNLWLKNSWTS